MSQIVTYDTPERRGPRLMRGEIDMVQEVNRDSVEFLEGASRFETYPSIRPFYIPLVFNLRHPILGRVEVRRALAEAINRDEIVERAHAWPWTSRRRSHLALALGLQRRRREIRPMIRSAARRSSRRRRASGQASAATPGRMPSRFRIQCLFWDKIRSTSGSRCCCSASWPRSAWTWSSNPRPGTSCETRAGSGEFESYLFQMTSGKSFDLDLSFLAFSGPAA